MGFWTLSNGIRGRSALRRSVPVALALVLATLAGGLPTNRTVAQDVPIQLVPKFSPRTPPLNSGDICVDQNYDIEVTPLVIVGGGTPPVPLYGGSIVSTIKPQVGTLNGTDGPVGRFVDTGGAAIFTYRAINTGSESLNFGLLSFIEPSVRDNPDYDSLGQLARARYLKRRDFKFKVVECHYKVKMDIEWHYSDSGLYLGAFALTAETKLDRQSDGTLKNSESFDFTYVGAGISDCTVDFSRFSVPVGITGKDLVRGDPEYQRAGESLKLDFSFSTATENAAFTCPETGANLASTVNVAKSVGIVETTFPPEGAFRTFPMPMEGEGKFGVTLTRVRSDK